MIKRAEICSVMTSVGLSRYACVCIDGLVLRKIKNGPDFTPRFAVMGLFPYAAREEIEKEGNISLYARGEDYHSVAGRILGRAAELLKKSHEGNFAVYCDNSPLDEVGCAVRAGLGRRGMHGLLISPGCASFCFIGEILTDCEAEEFSSVDEKLPCTGCEACVAACPTGALSVGECGMLRCDYDKCLSRITQKKGDLTPQEQSIIKKTGMVWGCDACQRACPYAVDISACIMREFSANTISSLHGADVEALSNRMLGEKYPHRAFTWRGAAVLKRNLAIIEGKNEDEP